MTWFRAVGLAAAGMLGPAVVAAQDLHQVQFDSLDGTPLKAWVNRPAAGTATRGLVVALHGCGGLYATEGARRGLLSARHQMWADTLAREGFIVVLPDSLTPRGERELCTQRAAGRRVTQVERRRDALAALRWASTQHWGDIAAGSSGSATPSPTPTPTPLPMAVMGWSHGGSAVLSTTDATHAEVQALPVAARPRAAIAFYPGCVASLRSGYKPLAPLTLLLGADDDWTAPGPCVELGQRVGADVHLYPGAHHGFDGPVGQVRHLANVPNGVNPGKGVHVGPNPAARDAAHKQVRQVLDAAFAPGSNGPGGPAR